MSRWLSQINQLDRRYRPLLHHETIAARQSETREAIKVQAQAATATATSAALVDPEAIAKAITVAPGVIVALLPTA